MSAGADWREDIDALQFATGNGGACTVHRLAFRRLLGFTPLRADCMAYFAAHAPAFGAAAAEKIALRGIASGRNLHLTSRDIRRQLELAPPALKRDSAGSNELKRLQKTVVVM